MATAAVKRKRTELSLGDKIKILDAVKRGDKQVKIAGEFHVAPSTITELKKKQAALREAAALNADSSRKRKRAGSTEDVDNACLQWLKQILAANGVVNGPLLKEKASQFAVTLHCDGFTPSNGWLHRFKKRANLKFVQLCGERAAADEVGAAEWIEAQLPGLIEGFEERDIFNADETGLFFRATPTRSFAFAGSNPPGGKVAKERLTALLLCNMDGSHKQVFAIGKFRNPRCFKNVTNPPLPYFSSGNAWMTSELFSKIVLKFDQQMMSEKRKVILFVDNAACHKLNFEPGNVQVRFLPPNTTSIIQPLDQGVIHSVKVHYRTQLVRKMLVAMDKGDTAIDFSKSVNLLRALYMLKQALFLLKPSTVQNCFRKAGFKKQQDISAEESTEPLPSAIGGLSVEEFTEFVGCDSGLPCSGELTDAEICLEVSGPGHPEAEEAEDVEDTWDEEDEVRVPAKVALGALETLGKFMEQNGVPFQQLTYAAMEEQLEDKIAASRKNTKITDFFK